jgi:hypothetical protein
LYPTMGHLRQSKTYELGLTFIKSCSDLWPYTKGSAKNGRKKVLVTDG